MPETNRPEFKRFPGLVVDGRISNAIYSAIKLTEGQECWLRAKCNWERRSRTAILNEYGVPPEGREEEFCGCPKGTHNARD